MLTRFIYLVREFNQLKLLVRHREELGRTGEGDRTDSNKTIVQGLVVLDALAEGVSLQNIIRVYTKGRSPNHKSCNKMVVYLIVDGKGRHLHGQLDKVHSAVEQRWFELAFEVDFLHSEKCTDTCQTIEIQLIIHARNNLPKTTRANTSKKASSSIIKYPDTHGSQALASALM